MKRLKLSSAALIVVSVTALNGCGFGGPSFNAGIVATEPPPASQQSVQGERDFTQTADEPVSTFAVDVDTGSYTYARKMLSQGKLPEQSAVRPEEFINFFDYELAQPGPGEDPLKLTLDGAPSPFGQGLHLLRVALKAAELKADQRLPSNLVFLIDVSGSMQAPDKLPLVKSALKTLVAALNENDRLSLVVYAGSDRVVLEPMAGTEANRAAMITAIDALDAGGSTAGEKGIQRAYDIAESAFIKGGNNRVILCTDGDFNVGLVGDDLTRLIEERRDRGVTLTTLGFGTGNYKDSQLEQLADHGNGMYAYVDSQEEADRLFGKELVSSLQLVAKDTKIQLTFDPAAVIRYRLIGYDNRLLANEDFANDKKDAGDIGAGHHVVALYEVELTPASTAPLATIALRWKAPEDMTSVERAVPFARSAVVANFSEAPDDLQFAAAVAELAERLRDSMHAIDGSLEEVRALGMASIGTHAERSEIATLVDQAQPLLQKR